MPREISRKEFIESKWNAKPGEHILFVAPTGAGKSYLAWQLLEQTMKDYPEQQYMVLMPKKEDPVTSNCGPELGLKRVSEFPPKRKFLERFGEPPRGYIVWPNHNPALAPEERRMDVSQHLKRAMEYQYQSGDSVTFLDDAHSAAALMKINPGIEEILTNGRAGGNGLWLATQKPSGSVSSGGLTSFAWGSSSKMFFSRDNDKRNIKRLSEIGGASPYELYDIISNLNVYMIDGHPVSEFLYLSKGGGSRGYTAALIQPV